MAKLFGSGDVGLAIKKGAQFAAGYSGLGIDGEGDAGAPPGIKEKLARGLDFVGSPSIKESLTTEKDRDYKSALSQRNLALAQKTMSEIDQRNRPVEFMKILNDVIDPTKKASGKIQKIFELDHNIPFEEGQMNMTSGMWEDLEKEGKIDFPAISNVFAEASTDVQEAMASSRATLNKGLESAGITTEQLKQPEIAQQFPKLVAQQAAIEGMGDRHEKIQDLMGYMNRRNALYNAPTKAMAERSHLSSLVRKSHLENPDISLDVIRGVVYGNEIYTLERAALSVLSYIPTAKDIADGKVSPEDWNMIALTVDENANAGTIERVMTKKAIMTEELIKKAATARFNLNQGIKGEGGTGNATAPTVTINDSTSDEGIENELQRDLLPS
jgi:iron-sulfur cluster repair protein YtfE (RIC family)